MEKKIALPSDFRNYLKIGLPKMKKSERERLMKWTIEGYKQINQILLLNLNNLP